MLLLPKVILAVSLASAGPQLLRSAPPSPPVPSLESLASPSLASPSGRNFLVYDPRGDGRAVEVVGDLSRAGRIAILVPGTDTTLRDFDRGLGGVTRRAPSVQARALFDAAGRDPAVAVIAWLGYDPPEGLGPAVARAGRASAGAVELQRFVASLPAAATKVVIGHSYGTVVVGLAAQGFGPDVTDIVALASPGMGVSSRAELNFGGRLWAATAEADWIRRVPHVKFAGFGHGADPCDAGFGALRLATDGVSNHDSYLVPGSATLDALGGMLSEESLAIR